MRITESLQIEHQLLRKMMAAMSRWLNDGLERDRLRERAVMLEAALNLHLEREERCLLVPLNDYSDDARDLVTRMEKVHLEVRKLFEALADSASEPQDLLPQIISYASAHLSEEETRLFPLAEKLLQPEVLEDDCPNIHTNEE